MAVSLRFVHTADWQIGMPSVRFGRRAREFADGRLAAARRVLRLAESTGADFVVVVGDLFDRPDLDGQLLNRTVELLNAHATVPILVLPGNHDPLTEGSVWSRAEWRQVDDHVVLLDRAEPTVVPQLGRDDVVFYPCPIRQKRSRLDPTAWIPERAADQEDVLRIGVAHGALDSVGPAENFPVARNRSQLSGLDFLALGDWHGMSQFDRAAYPSTPEQCNFKERNAGCALVVSLESGREPRVERHRTGRWTWWEQTVELRTPEQLAALQRSIAGQAAPADLVLRLQVELIGAELDLLEQTQDWLEQLRQDAFHAEIELRAIELTGDELASPLVAAVDGSLHDLEVHGATPEGLEQLADTPREVVQEARLLLRSWLATSRADLPGDGGGGAP